VDVWASVCVVVSNVTFHFFVTVATKIVNVRVCNMVRRLYRCVRLDILCLVNELWQLVGDLLCRLACDWVAP
jgi:hypothetical protein